MLHGFACFGARLHCTSCASCHLFACSRSPTFPCVCCSQEPAERLECQLGLQASLWDQQPWFQAVWLAPDNNRDGRGQAVPSNVEEVSHGTAASYKHWKQRRPRMTAAERLGWCVGWCMSLTSCFLFHLLDYGGAHGC